MSGNEERTVAEALKSAVPSQRQSSTNSLQNLPWDQPMSTRRRRKRRNGCRFPGIDHKLGFSRAGYRTHDDGSSHIVSLYMPK